MGKLATILIIFAIAVVAASHGFARSASSVTLLAPPDHMKVKLPSLLDPRFYTSKVHFAWHIEGCNVVEYSDLAFGPDDGQARLYESPSQSADGYYDLPVGTLGLVNPEWHVMYLCQDSPHPLDSASRTVDVGQAKKRGKGCGVTKVTYVSGDVTVDGMTTAKGNLIDPQAYVITGLGRLEFKSQDGSVYRIGGHSRMDLANLPCRGPEDRKVTAKIVVGDIWAKVAHLVGGDEKFKLESQNAVVGVRGTTLEITVNDAQTQTRVHTIVGAVTARGAGRTVTVKKGRCSTITAAGPSKPVPC
ncbi:MAG: FecR protein [Gaiellaceae bacterium]|jgi:hypothetical protein|nr:FecR protein [Gaiellaceae bacterium]